MGVGFGYHGEAVVHEKGTTQLHKYQIQEWGTYEEIWNKEALLPSFKEDGSTIAISISGILLAQDTTGLVMGSTPEGKFLDTWDHPGRLLTCVPTTDLNFVYGKHMA